MEHPTDYPDSENAAVRRPPELELSDEDILDAMAHIQGYLDISTEDFRAIYHLAHKHAVERLFARLRAQGLMRRNVPTLAVDLTLDVAARIIAASGLKGLPVTDAEGHVLGMLTETDYLRQLKADSFLGLLLSVIEGSGEISHRCHETPVGDAMTAPAVTIGLDDDFAQVMAAFRRHPGRATPVVGADSRLCGLLLRKDFLAAFLRDDQP